jgi:hypothetical protein
MPRIEACIALQSSFDRLLSIARPYFTTLALPPPSIPTMLSSDPDQDAHRMLVNSLMDPTDSSGPLSPKARPPSAGNRIILPALPQTSSPPSTRAVNAGSGSAKQPKRGDSGATSAAKPNRKLKRMMSKVTFSDEKKDASLRKSEETVPQVDPKATGVLPTSSAMDTLFASPRRLFLITLLSPFMI